MNDFVRVKDPDTGHEISVSAEQADLVGVRPLSKAAVDAQGKPLPVKTSVTVDEAAAKKVSA